MKVNVKFWMTCVCLITPMAIEAQTVSLDACQQAARDNYPLIKRYDLIGKTTRLTVSNLNKQWLPQVSAAAQASLQNRVVALPDALLTMLEQQGYGAKGLKKDQYKIGVDVQQNLWDGGRIKYQKEMARAQGEVDKAQNDVDLYAVAQRVNEMYFSVLTLDEQLKINEDLQTLLKSNLDKLEAMYQRGTAMRSDVNSMKAEKLNAEQQETDLRSVRQSVLRMLSVFCGIPIPAVSKPVAISTTTDNNRPELRLVDARLKLADAQEKSLRSELMPRLSAFAQGFYGYPGYDMFHDMYHHEFSWNGMIGVKLSWSIGALYTHKNDLAKIQTLRDREENARETFLFNNQLDQISQGEEISKYQKMMKEDDEIVDLRRDVRLAAESKLRHGIIDVNHLLQEINRENQAKNNRSLHEVGMLKQMYDLKYTKNQ